MGSVNGTLRGSPTSYVSTGKPVVVVTPDADSLAAMGTNQRDQIRSHQRLIVVAIVTTFGQINDQLEGNHCRRLETPLDCR
jgi:hypothetical protein